MYLSQVSSTLHWFARRGHVFFRTIRISSLVAVTQAGLGFQGKVFNVSWVVSSTLGSAPPGNTLSNVTWIPTLRHSTPSEPAHDRRRGNVKGVRGLLPAIWSRLSYMCHIRSTAVCDGVHTKYTPVTRQQGEASGLRFEGRLCMYMNLPENVLYIDTYVNI